MEVNAVKIKNLRTERNWTQQHLADACAISLRTVQRVERYGNASNETLMSLAAVFNIKQSDLVLPNEPVEQIEPVIMFDKGRERKLVFTALTLGMGLGASFMFLVNLWS